MNDIKIFEVIASKKQRALDAAQCLDTYHNRRTMDFDFPRHHEESLLLTELTLIARLLSSKDPVSEVEELIRAAEKIVGYVKSGS